MSDRWKGSSGMAGWTKEGVIQESGGVVTVSFSRMNVVVTLM